MYQVIITYRDGDTYRTKFYDREFACQAAMDSVIDASTVVARAQVFNDSYRIMTIEGASYA